MMRASVPAALALTMLASACATQPDAALATATAPAATTAQVAAAYRSADEDAILTAVDRFLLAVGNHDHIEMEDILIEEGVAWFQTRTGDAEGRVQPFLNGTLMEEDPDGDPFIERYWDPIVLVRGGIATVWAPYELRDNGAQVHCGVDVLGLVKTQGAWRVANVMSTMEPGACAELGAESAQSVRPRDGWRETRNE